MTVNSILSRLAQPAVVIVFPEASERRSRRVVSRSRSRPTGKYPSWKMARMVQWESHANTKPLVAAALKLNLG
ncbi:MAG: hypothetical protein EPO19_09230 [Betaproteobacteria bacterium]|nr:MAG: hypothetical protein EPO19_09230 [Betaproteobacteria bacterium]